MALTHNNIEERLLANHLFPRVSKYADELPPCFTSQDFTKKVANLLVQQQKRPDGYDTVSLKLPRHDLSPRSLEVPHPVPFANLVRELKTFWNEWEHARDNPSSAIPISDHEDQRVFAMIAQSSESDLEYPGARFYAKTDIATFYASIYTHSIPWAIQGIPAAKKSNRKHWSDKIDQAASSMRRKETTGLPIGPATSSILGELILEPIDRSLRNGCTSSENSYNFVRFIDDYHCFTDTREQAESFIGDLQELVERFRLSLNLHKTHVGELPKARIPHWMHEIDMITAGRRTPKRLMRLLDSAITNQEHTPEGGSIQYALTVVESEISKIKERDSYKATIVDRLLHIGFSTPSAIGTACRTLLQMGSAAVDTRVEHLNTLLIEHAQNRRTDAITWLMYTLFTSGQDLTSAAIDAIVQSRDGLSLALLATNDRAAGHAMSFARQVALEARNKHEMDEYWILFYTLSMSGQRIEEESILSYVEELNPLIDAQVHFVDMSRNTADTVRSSTRAVRGESTIPRRSSPYENY